MSARTVHCKHCKHFIRQRPQDGIWIHVGTNRAVCSWAEPREGHQKPALSAYETTPRPLSGSTEIRREFPEPVYIAPPVHEFGSGA